MPSNHLVLCRPLLLLPSIFPSFWSFPKSVLHIRGPKYTLVTPLECKFLPHWRTPACPMQKCVLLHLHWTISLSPNSHKALLSFFSRVPFWGPTLPWSQAAREDTIPPSVRKAEDVIFLWSSRRTELNFLSLLQSKPRNCQTYHLGHRDPRVTCVSSRARLGAEGWKEIAPWLHVSLGTVGNRGLPWW